MSMEEIETKLMQLSARVKQLEAKAKASKKRGWRAIVGTSRGDEIDREAARLGEEWRAEQNRLPTED